MSSKVDGRFEGRVAIVTGASRGIGKATALAFAAEGAKVVVNFHKKRKNAEEVVETIKEKGGDAFAFQADVADRGMVENMVDETLSNFDSIDVLVNNAGVLMGGGLLLELNDEEYDPMWRVNVKGVLNCTRAVVPHMMEKKYGKVVNISSVAGVGTAFAGDMLYSTTKASVIMMTKHFALELGQYGINVNAVAPGLIWTDMMGSLNPEEREQQMKSFEEMCVLHRIGKPEEIANVVLFLASEESSFMTAQVLTVDGGRTNFITRSL